MVPLRLLKGVLFLVLVLVRGQLNPQTVLKVARLQRLLQPVFVGVDDFAKRDLKPLL